ncbi:PIN domain-containing protein [Candidatus Laterigemmans baculatus]|uniref:PIN domain-containing protein n=1 Tax=Candidatus Laterigemmans baculatus TaxID=2770505 RepID=UPI0013DD0EFF|nr:PIN domain-containing protein [Candidatus Laterigemmans baculatus]
MRTNYVLIDFENVQPTSLAELDAEHFRVLVFVGANQNKLDFETAAGLQRLGPRAEYVKISGNGSNSLDFHIAFYIGSLSAANPDAVFHIVSKDKGFDPLIQHLKGRNVSVTRSAGVANIQMRNTARSKTIAERVAIVVDNLRQRGTSKPRTVKTLTSTINSLFQKQLTDEELASVVRCMQSLGIVAIEGAKVTYALGSAAALKPPP